MMYVRCKETTWYVCNTFDAVCLVNIPMDTCLRCVVVVLVLVLAVVVVYGWLSVRCVSSILIVTFCTFRYGFIGIHVESFPRDVVAWSGFQK